MPRARQVELWSIYMLLCAKQRGNIITININEGTVVMYMKHTWGTRNGHTSEIVESIKAYLAEHPVDYQGQVDNLFELLYCAYTEYNSVETPEFNDMVDPLSDKLKDLAGNDDEADEYMESVFGMCSAYERQSYVEGIKVGMRLVMELMEG